jgi:Protein of unknown function (DUF2905)
MNSTGKSIVMLGLVLVVAGLLIGYGGKLPFRLGRLPGDVSFGGKNTRFYFPLGTSLLLSAVLSLLAWLFRSR